MNLPTTPRQLLADSASLLHAKQRILDVIWPQNCGFDPSILVPRQLTGHEQLSEDYAYELELACIDETLPAKYLHGLPIGVARSACKVTWLTTGFKRAWTASNASASNSEFAANRNGNSR